MRISSSRHFLVPMTGLMLAAWSALGTACGGAAPKKQAVEGKTADPYRAKVAALVEPMLDSELIHSLAIGVYAADRSFTYGFGGSEPPTADTIFEIGPVSQVFTGLLFAEALERREVAVDTTLISLLPMGVTAPGTPDRPITLGDLARHQAGLANVPPSVARQERGGDPYAGYGDDHLYRDLIRTQLLGAPGDQVRYSSYGYGILGHALALRAKTGFTDLLATRILGPLGLTSTFVNVPAGHASRHASGHAATGAPARFSSFTSTMAGLGGLRSSVRDLLALAKASLASPQSRARGPLGKVLARAQDLRGDGPIGWQVDDDERLFHAGSTRGFHAYIGLDLERRHAVVMLASTASSQLDRLVVPLFSVLSGGAPAPLSFPSADALQRCVGTYQVQPDEGATPGAPIAVRLEGKKLLATGTGQDAVRLAPISPDAFWIDELGAEVRFAADEMLIIVGNQQISAKRVPK